MGVFNRVLDLTSIQEGCIAHGVNCQQRMGAGVAKNLYTKWPQVKSTYLGVPQNTMKLGLIQPVRITDKLAIVNCFTQVYYGRETNCKYANPQAIATCLDKTMKWMLEHHLCTLYIPYIGCNLGGLDWDTEVLPVVKAVSLLHPRVDIVVCAMP